MGVTDDLRRVLPRLVAAGHLVATELDTLELLAYGAASGSETKVAGGDVIDLHGVGDQRARTALAAIERHVGPLLAGFDNALALVHTGGPDGPAPRTRQQISRRDHSDALAAQERRKARGEYTPPRDPPPAARRIKNSRPSFYKVVACARTSISTRGRSRYTISVFPD